MFCISTKIYKDGRKRWWCSVGNGKRDAPLLTQQNPVPSIAALMDSNIREWSFLTERMVEKFKLATVSNEN